MFTLSHVVPWGRSFEEYCSMFGLGADDFAGRILGCGDGPAAFNATASSKGYSVTSCDPLYQWTGEQIQSRIDATSREVLAETRKHAHQFVWDTMGSVDTLAAVRMEAMRTFLNDYPTGAQQGRYVAAALPTLPFGAGEFDLALCSHFLFLYSTHLGRDFHVASALELVRVAREVRVFPLLALGGDRSPFVTEVIRALTALGHVATIERVPYEFQRGGHEMLRVIRRPGPSLARGRGGSERTGTTPASLILRVDESQACELTSAIHSGDLPSLSRLIEAHPALATSRIVDTHGVSRTLVHVATDWPGHLPNVAGLIALLARFGAAVDAPVIHAVSPGHAETPLHWAASSNDVAAIDALLDAGANLEAPGAVFTGGTAMSDAVVFAQWDAARRLLDRGATTTLWQAAALGLLDRTRALSNATPPRSPRDITNAFWHACRGGQMATAQCLLDAGADASWVGHDRKTPLDVARENGHTALVEWLERHLPTS